tara:strand:- start:245 stop:1183 length:939 start_codon:yes stop_codon:yes gene_type:complete
MNQIYKLNKKKLSQIESTNFNLEKEIQTIVENNTEELFEIKLVKSEFSVNGYRIDTLCFDEESNSFVIIEYKKDKSYSVIDQGYSYLSTMLNNKSDFILEFIENSEKSIKKNQIDWSQSRIIFISTFFSSHQKNSVNFKDVPFELWEISKFSNDLISFNQITSTSKESITKISGNTGSVISKVGQEIEVYDEETHLNRVSPHVKDLYLELKERMMSWDDVKFNYKKRYISVSRGKNIKIYLNLQKQRIKIHLLRRISFKGDLKSSKISFTIKDPNKLFKLIKETHKEQYQYYLKDTKNLDYITLLLKQKFDS